MTDHYNLKLPFRIEDEPISVPKFESAVQAFALKIPKSGKSSYSMLALPPIEEPDIRFAPDLFLTCERIRNTLATEVGHLPNLVRDWCAEYDCHVFEHLDSSYALSDSYSANGWLLRWSTKENCPALLQWYSNQSGGYDHNVRVDILLDASGLSERVATCYEKLIFGDPKARSTAECDIGGWRDVQLKLGRLERGLRSGSVGLDMSEYRKGDLELFEDYLYVAKTSLSGGPPRELE